MEIEMENNEAITTLNTPDDLGIYSNDEDNIDNLSLLDENFHGFVNPYVDDIKKIRLEISELKSQLSTEEYNLSLIPKINIGFLDIQRRAKEVNISFLKEKLNNLNDKLNSLLLLIQKNVIKRVPVSSDRSSIPLQNQVINNSDIKIEELSDNEIKKEEIKDNEAFSKKEELSKGEFSSNTNEDGKIFGFTKVGFSIGLGVVLLAAGFITYKIIKK